MLDLQLHHASNLARQLLYRTNGYYVTVTIQNIYGGIYMVAAYLHTSSMLCCCMPIS